MYFNILLPKLSVKQVSCGLFKLSKGVCTAPCLGTTPYCPICSCKLHSPCGETRPLLYLFLYPHTKAIHPGLTRCYAILGYHCFALPQCYTYTACSLLSLHVKCYSIKLYSSYSKYIAALPCVLC